MAILGIESSAHTFGMGIVENGKILANEKMMYPIGKTGIIPAKAADYHTGNVNALLKAVLAKAKLEITDIKGVGYTKGPGLGPCLRVGQIAAKAIAQSQSIPIVSVNHAVGHIEIARQRISFKDPLVLYVSGGNSQILGIKEEPFRHYHVFGETLDIGIGNMLDNFARAAKLDPAWGSSVAKLAEGGSYIDMPYTVKGMDFTFTGLLTHAVQRLQDKGSKPKDIAYSLQETSFAMLCEALERALFLTGKEEMLLCGGVAQSKRLNEMIRLMAKPHKTKVFTADSELNADNGAMIAIVAELMFKSKMAEKPEQCDINQKYRIDSVRIGW